MTSKPFAEALKDLLVERDVSQRTLAKRINNRKGRQRASSATISRLSQGTIAPTMAMMAAIARELGVNPEHFAEYRLEKRRAELDWRTRPLRSCLRALDE